jgi:hypothetical protein
MATTVAKATTIESAQVRIQSIAFRFQPVTIGEKQAFHVEVRFRAAEQVTTIRVAGGAP